MPQGLASGRWDRQIQWTVCAKDCLAAPTAAPNKTTAASSKLCNGYRMLHSHC